MTAHRAPDASSAQAARSKDRPPTHPSAPSMDELLAAGPAATAVSTPPSAPEPEAEQRTAPRRLGERDAA